MNATQEFILMQAIGFHIYFDDNSDLKELSRFASGLEKDTPFTVITVINSCSENPFHEQTGKLISKKFDRQKHGYGLKSIRKTISKYQGDLQMYYENDTRTFRTIIMLRRPHYSPPSSAMQTT